MNATMAKVLDAGGAGSGDGVGLEDGSVLVPVAPVEAA